MLEKLLEYQKIDSTLREIEVEVSNSEERKKAISAQTFLKSVDENLIKLDGHAKDLANEFSAISKTYEKLKESQRDYENVIDTSENSNELSYVRKKAKALSAEINSLLANLERVEKEIAGVLNEYSALKAKTKEAKKQRDEFAPKYKELKASKESAMKDIKEQLVALEKDVNPDLLKTYQQKRKDKIFPVIYAVKTIGKAMHCARCGTELSMVAKNNVKAGELIECDSCHRLLYLTKETKGKK